MAVGGVASSLATAAAFGIAFALMPRDQRPKKAR
jgi:hypothetical protein